MRSIGATLLFLTVLWSSLLAQSDERANIVVKKIDAPVMIDGILNEPFWKEIEPAQDFYQYFPSDSTKAKDDTQVYFAYDKSNLYIGVRCFSSGNKFVTPSLKRDYDGNGSDNFTLILDTYKDQTNAFVFGINPFGVKREGLIINGGNEEKDISFVWDNKWEAETAIAQAYWMAEIKIPLSSIRFNHNSNSWNINCYRKNTISNEKTVWQRVNRNHPIFNLAFGAELTFESNLPKIDKTVSIIPYSAGTISQESENQGGPLLSPKFKTRGGLDARIALTSSLNLNVTVNPDFSQVEVDHQRTNLSRFQIKFPEQRQFFLEDQDLFGNFGSSKINPFFSRRIGLSQDFSTGSSIENPIYAGVRLSGKLNNDWRIGLLSTQTGKDLASDQPSFNYSAISLRKKVYGNSFVSMLFGNRQMFDKEKPHQYLERFSRVAAIEYNLATNNNKWAGKVFYQHNFRPDSTYRLPIAQGAEITYKRRRFSVEWLHQFVGKDYQPMTGFTPRKDFFRLNPNTQFYFYPNDGLVIEHGPGIEINEIYQKNVGSTDKGYELFYNIKFNNNQELQVKYDQLDIFLFDPFDPIGNNLLTLPDSTYYFTNSYSADYKSDPRKWFNYRIIGKYGKYYSGNLYELKSSFNLRFQPYGNISLETDITRIDLKDQWSQEEYLFLISPRVDLTFTKNLFFTTFIQYNSQIDNLNINSRFQWRFAPVSDFFIVYTENFYSDSYDSKGRAIVAKLTYWLNL